MANYPKELVDLLQQYMTDGVMTAKERAVLLRKAESLGVDKDEFDLYIDAEEQKFEQKIDAAKRQAKGKLCPFCYASVPMFTDKCPKCDRNITPEATKDLEEIINKLEDALVNFKDSQNIARSKAEAERYIRKAELYYENNPKIKKLLSAIKDELKAGEKLKELNEITAYLEEALVNLKSADNYQRSKAEVERYIHMAEMRFENDPKIQELLVKVKKEKNKAENRYNRGKIWQTIKFIWSLMTNIIFWCVVAALVGVYYYYFDDQSVAQLLWVISGLVALVGTMMRQLNKEDKKEKEHEKEMARIKSGLSDNKRK